MRFKRELWQVKGHQTFPAWPCPSCPDGILDPKDQQTWLTHETVASRTAKRERSDEWEPDWLEERTSGCFRCNRCDDFVAFVADVAYQQVFDPETGVEFVGVHQPLFFSPTVPMIDIPEEASPEVRDALTRAFAQYWSDPSSSGNCIRTAIEAMLDQEKIPRGRNDNNAKRRIRHSLHARLMLYAAKAPALTQPLLALKWLGNTGTHDVLSHDDVLDALGLLDHTLDEVYREHSKTILKTAKAINRRKGPLRPPKRGP
jgi:hypothetical protein